MKNKFLKNNPTANPVAPAQSNYVQAGTGKPVVMVHGLAASLHDWDMLLPEFITRGYAGYALDLLGHGESPKPKGPDQYTSESVFAHMAACMVSLNIDEPAILIGHSLGGYMCLKYTLQNPERVRALVLVNPFFSQSQLPPMLRFFLRRPLLNTNLIERTPYWLFRMLIDVTSLQFGSSSERMHNLPELVRIQTALDYKRAAPGIYNIPRTLHELDPNLSHISQPTLVIWGARDQTIDPKTFPRLVEKLPNARAEIMPVCGHVPHQCHAKEFNKKVFDFLNNL